MLPTDFPEDSISQADSAVGVEERKERNPTQSPKSTERGLGKRRGGGTHRSPVEEYAEN